jgi:serine protease Do
MIPGRGKFDRPMISKLVRTYLPVVLILGMVGFPTSARGKGVLQAIEKEIANLLEQNRACVVRIHAIYSPDSHAESLQYGSGYTHGTGFVFDPEGFVVTVDKAVVGAREIRVTLADGEVRTASFVASDPASNVAVIHIDASDDLPHVRPGNSDEVRVGHYSFILGNAFGQLVPSIGSVHEINQDEDLIQLMSTVHPSYGGAPVFDSAGQVLGMVWAAPFQSSDPLSSVTHEAPRTVFVIPINRLERIAGDLVRQGQVNYGWLGVEVDEDSYPVVVTRVAENGPAWNCGVREGHRILSYGGHTVTGPFHLRRLVMETPPGTAVQIQLEKGDRDVAAEVEVTERSVADAGSRVLSELDPNAKPAALSLDERTTPPPEEMLFDQIRAVEQELGRLRKLIRSP